MNNTYTSFQDIVKEGMKIGWLRRLAHINENGEITGSISNQITDEYIRNVGNCLTAVEAGITQCHQLRRQIENPPSKDWLDLVKVSRLDFLQQSADFLTLISHSLFDRTLILINETYSFGLAPKECKGRSIKQKLGKAKTSQEFLLNKLADLDSTCSKIADERNKFAHRGEEREYPDFSSFRRTQSVISAFDIPTGNMKFDQKAAEESLASYLLDEYLEIAINTGKVFPALIPEFSDQIARKGGIGQLSQEEMKRAVLVDNYFRGGRLPEFWNIG